MAVERAINPFFHRGPIRDLAYFYGRQRETRLVLGLVRNAQCVSVLGQRRIGKSSFVLHAAHPLVLQAHGLNPDQFGIVYVDCQGRSGATEAELCSLLLDGLRTALATRVQLDELHSDEAPPDLSCLEAIFTEVTQAGYRPVFILDEFEALATSHHLTPDFFSSLRRLVTQYPVAVVTVTKDPLSALSHAHESILSSPFFNIFQHLWLGLYGADEAVEMLQGLAGKSDLHFTQATVDFILDLAGGHPLLLQLAGFHAFELLEYKSGDLSTAECQLVRERFWVTAVQHYEYYWNHLDEQTHYLLATLPLSSTAGGDSLEALVKDSLIVQRGAGYDYFSSSFRDFVYRRKVPGLAYAGPFIVDQHRRAVLLLGRPLDLARTEYDLFVYLLQRTGMVVAYAEIERNVWGDAYSGDPERLKAAIKHLRQAMGEHADYVENVRGVGYRLRL